MSEGITVSEVSPVEQAQRRHDTAIEVAFGVTDDENSKYPGFVGLVDYKIGGNEKKQQFAELAVEELFRSGANLEKVDRDEKLKSLSPNSNEALELQKTGPKEIAFDYILGDRVRPNSIEIATEVYEDYLLKAMESRDDFIKMKRKQIKWKGKGNPQEQEKYRVFTFDSKTQIREASEFINNKYKFDVPDVDRIDVSSRVVENKQGLTYPSLEKQLAA